MRYWHFRFEGIFTSKHEENAGWGVFSNCLVPISNYYSAKKRFLAGLKENSIDLIEVLASTSVNKDELDPNDPANHFWIEWCETVWRKGDIDFSACCLYDPLQGDEDED